MTENTNQATIAGDAKVAHTLIGRVVSDKRDKTVTLLVERRVKHPLYGKVVIRSTKYQAHDENNECHVGDLVEIQPTRKISKTKSWAVSRLIEKAVNV
jgi:small subunit ribosomal protein S17